ncbi:MAG: NRDE family protein, partial [Candidatus Binatia bacterium]
MPAAPRLYSAPTMCTLALYFQVFPQYPIVVAANRDEFLARPSSPPTQLWSAPWVYGGKDLLVGGTWLGINESGVVAGILNRQSSGAPDLERRSRGLLCLDALQCPSATTALQCVMTQSATQYNPLNLLIADHTSAYVISTGNGTFFVVHSLTPGLHLLTNRDPNDADCPRITYSSHRFLQVSQDLAAKPTPVANI